MHVFTTTTLGRSHQGAKRDFNVSPTTEYYLCCAADICRENHRGRRELEAGITGKNGCSVQLCMHRSFPVMPEASAVGHF